MPSTCLIAAHDPWFIQLLRIYSEESGFKTIQAYEGQDVLPAAMQVKPVVILLQVDLPGQLSGRDVLKILKREPATAHTPVLAFSWHSLESTPDLAGDVVAHLQEPITYDGFVDALEKAGVHCQARSRTGESDLHGDRGPTPGGIAKSSLRKASRRAR